MEYIRDQSLLDVPPHLFPSHHNHQLGRQLNQTATRVALGVKTEEAWGKPQDTTLPVAN